MSICRLCRSECEEEYCSSCQGAIIKLGTIIQSMGVTFDEAIDAMNSMKQEDENE